MQITFFSFFISVIWSSVLVIITFLCRKKHFFIKQFGIVSLLLLYLFCGVRMVVPFEFSFTKVLAFKGIFSDIYKNIGLRKIEPFNISILTILFAIWLIISAVLITRFVYQYLLDIW